MERMLRKQIEQHIMKTLGEQSPSQIELHKEEKDYVEKYSLIEDGIKIIEKEENARFANAYIERCDKELENLIAIETDVFLNQPLEYLQKNKNEFVYLESKWFDLIGVEGICLEVDDLFGNYEALLGLKLQKKFDKAIRDYLQTELIADEAKFALIFNSEDGLWDLNIPINDIKGFREELSIGEAYQLIYTFLFKLAEAVEEGK